MVGMAGLKDPIWDPHIIIHGNAHCRQTFSVCTLILLSFHLQISDLISKLKDTLTAKERELTAFKDKHNIHVKGEKESHPDDSVQTADKTSGVLVAQDNS